MKPCDYCGTPTDDDLCKRCKPIWGDRYREDDDRWQSEED